MQRYLKTKRRQSEKQRKAPAQAVKASIVSIFDDVSDFVIDGLKSFPFEDGEYNTNQQRKIS